MMKSILVLMVFVPIVSGTSDPPIHASVLSESRLMIEGTSTVHRFSCEGNDVRGSGSFVNGRAQGRLAIAVAALDCGNGRMNRDLMTAMQAETHPLIEFRLDASETPMKMAAGSVRIPGHLCIAGVERRIAIEAVIEQIGDRTYRIRGSNDVLMSDFGIQPPTALAGLIRVHDRIVVRFDLVTSTSERLRADTAAIVEIQ